MMRECICYLMLVVACSEPSSLVAPAAASASKTTAESEFARITLTPRASERLGISVAPVANALLPKHRLVGGEVVGPPGNSIQLTAPFAALVANAQLPKPGALVTRGAPLISLTPLAPVDRDVRAQTERQRVASEARASAAEARLARSEKLLTDGAGSVRQVEEARAEAQVADAEREAARQRIESMARTPLATDVSVTLRAPYDGVVQRIGVSAGQNVAAGTLLIEVVGSREWWVRVPVFVAEARRVAAERAAQIHSFGASEAVEALPAHAPPVADAAGATVDFTYELPRVHPFRLGERVEVDLTFVDAGQQKSVPSSAVLRDLTGQAWVYVQTAPQQFLRQRVDVSRIEADSAVLSRGPDIGTLVVSVGAPELQAVELGSK